MLELGITFFVGLGCGLLFYKLRVPGGMMVGAIVGVCVLSILSGHAYVPPTAKLIAQCMAGAFIACSVEKSDLDCLPAVLGPSLCLLGAMLTLNMLVGFLIYWSSPLDLLTALMCAVPGGMSDIPIIATDMGADAAKVAALQFVRMSVGIGVFPSLIAFLTRGSDAPQPQENDCGVSFGRLTKREQSLRFLITMVVGGCCGIVGKWMGIPAGTLIFSMLGVIALKLMCGKAYLPIWAKRLAQVLSGAYIGCGITRGDLLEMHQLIIPILLLLSGYFLNCVLTGRLLHYFFDIPLKEAMLAATPAGATDMALISADLGVNSKNLVKLQIIRMVVVIAIFPQIIQLVFVLCGTPAL